MSHLLHKQFKSSRLGAALLSVLLLGCQAQNALQAPQSPQSQAQQAVQNQVIQTRSGVHGLSPRMQRMMQRARQMMAQPDYTARSTTQSLGDFGIQSARLINNKMYAVGGRGFATNRMDRIYEYDPVTHDLQEVGVTDLSDGTQIESAAIAKHPTTGAVYYLESYRSQRRLIHFDPATGERTVIGSTGLTTSIVQMTFNREEELYLLANNTELYRVNAYTAEVTAIPLTSTDGNGFGGGSGDIAFYVDNDIMYRMDGDGDLYEANLATATTRLVGSVSGIPSSDIVAGLGLNPAGQFVAFSVNTSTQDSRVYQVDPDTLSATVVATYNSSSTPSDTYPLADLSSSHQYTCPDVTSGRPTAPTVLYNHDFSSFNASLPNFGNLAWENNPDLSSGWRQWNADYFPVANGVKLYNPGPYDPSPGGIDDPANDVLGIRNFPGEYGPGGSKHVPEDPRPNLLETSIAKTTQLRYDVTQGDKVKAKVNVDPYFEHGDSDATIMLCFDDPAETIAVSSTLRGVGVENSELYVEAEIPACATQVTVIVMGYLGENEPTNGSVTFEDASLEFIPGQHYTETPLFSTNFDNGITHADFGTDFPADMDEQFGAYDIYISDKTDPATADKAVTFANPENSSDYGGLVKRVDLPQGYDPNSKLSAKMYMSTALSDPTSTASLLVDYFDASDNKLGTSNAQGVNLTQYRWIEVDRADIPTGTSYVKVVPIVKFGASESSSLLMDDLSVSLFSGS